MTLSVRFSRPATPEEWDGIWASCEHATFFHSRLWADVWLGYTHGALQPEPRLILFSDGARALLPLSCRQRLSGLVKQYVSSPARTYGGWISPDCLDDRHAGLLLGLLESSPNLVWRLNPYDRRQTLRSEEGCRQDETHTIPLGAGFEAVYREWSKGHRSAAKQAGRMGATVRLASTLDDWHAYFAVYQDSLRRWGDKATSRYRVDFFERLHALQSPYVKLWLATYEQGIIAGALCFYSKRHVVYWHGASLEKYFRVRPTNLLMYEAIRHACDQGYAWFDFNPSGRHEGVKAFKKSFGAKTLPCPVVTREGAMTRFTRTLHAVAGGSGVRRPR